MPLINILSSKRNFSKEIFSLLSFNKYFLILKYILVILLYNLAYRVTIYYTYKSYIILEAYS